MPMKRAKQGSSQLTSGTQSRRDSGLAREYERKVKTMLSFMAYADVLFVSALTGRRIPKLLETIREGGGSPQAKNSDIQGE